MSLPDYITLFCVEKLFIFDTAMIYKRKISANVFSHLETFSLITPSWIDTQSIRANSEREDYALTDNWQHLKADIEREHKSSPNQRNLT